MKFFIVFSALLILAAALPSNYIIMKQEKELLKDVLQYLENSQTEGIILYYNVIIYSITRVL